MADETVDKNNCKLIHVQVEKEFSNVAKALDRHTETLSSLKDVVVRLTVIQEIAVKSQDKTADNIQEHSKAIAKIDNRVLDRASEQDEREGVRTTQSEEKFWQSKLGERVINSAIVFFGVILLVALGQSLGVFDLILK